MLAWAVLHPRLTGAFAAAIALLALAMVITYGALRLDLAHTQTELATTAAVAKEQTARADDTVKVLGALIASDERAAAAEKQAATYKTTVQKQVDQIKRTIIDAPPSDDAPISPVLLRVLDGLRALPAPDSADAAAR